MRREDRQVEVGVEPGVSGEPAQGAQQEQRERRDEVNADGDGQEMLRVEAGHLRQCIREEDALRGRAEEEESGQERARGLLAVPEGDGYDQQVDAQQYGGAANGGGEVGVSRARKIAAPRPPPGA